MSRGLRDYAVVTGAYWVFTLTDGALRMLVLLWLHELGRSPLEIASLFLAYEALGVVTNFTGGWVGAHVGLKATLVVGLALQVLVCASLGWQASVLSVPLVLAALAASGVAKDLTKMSAKSFLKLVVPAGDGHGLLRWVALLTGSKNTLKGVGFFLGGALLAALGFRGACYGMAGALVLAALGAQALLPRAAGKAKRKPDLRQLVSADARVNWLSAARLFLFGARDVWFVLALPIYLAAELGWSHAAVGGALAGWVILYGVVQAGAPRVVGTAAAAGERRAPDARRLGGLTAALLAPLLGLALALAAGLAPVPTLVVGLLAFGFVFALNSALHSYLILAYAREEVSLDVGFYYTANAAGRLVGTLLSGALFQLAGQGRDGLLTCASPPRPRSSRCPRWRARPCAARSCDAQRPRAPHARASAEPCARRGRGPPASPTSRAAAAAFRHARGAAPPKNTRSRATSSPVTARDVGGEREEVAAGQHGERALERGLQHLVLRRVARGLEHGLHGLVARQRRAARGRRGELRVRAAEQRPSSARARSPDARASRAPTSPRRAARASRRPRRARAVP
ncbi:MAG: organoarsenical effux MFS transporter ArsJ [Planctomycetes bacterium]|nr:organoarsenical effux MFS transporter ArsJ [Planctomycetota bacterium]